MAWSFDVATGIPRINQSGTDTSYAGIATAITNQATVARSTAYVVGALVKPPLANGMWYRCSTAGTTAATAPLYNPVEATTTTDGTAVFTSLLAPVVQTLGTSNHYYMPRFRFQLQGTLTITNPQQENFTCWDVIMYNGTWTSGSWATGGVTPRWDGVHFCSVRVGFNGSDPASLSLQAGSQFTFIGGEVQVASAIGFDSGTTPRSYQTRWRNTKEWGASSSRIRNYTVNAIFTDCEFFDIAFDLFRMPTLAPSIKARGSEYVYQYVGSLAGGADSKFVASNLENVDGTYDFDNYAGGWVELYNCAKGVDLNVVSQYPGSSVWVRHCVPLYQDVTITAKDTTGTVVQDVRFTATESPTNAPTVTFTTVSSLKTWDFRTPLSYQTTTNASGIATSTPVLNVWYWQTSFKESLRFPSSTAVYEGRAYNYKTLNVSALLGASSAVQVSAGMIGLDTATTVTESVALAQTGIAFVPSGATGGTVTISSSHTLQEVWNYYRAWISAFANRSSNDTWTCLAGKISIGAWNLIVNSGVTLSGSGAVTSLATTGTVTNNGSITAIYSTPAGTSTIWEFQELALGNDSACAVWDSSGNTLLYARNPASATQRLYLPPGSTLGTLTYGVAKYGKRFEYGTFPANAGGILFYVPDYQDDVGITEATLATVEAYTAIDTSSKFYDRAGAFKLTEQGIKLGDIAVRSGTAIETGSYSILVKQNAYSVFSVVGSLITIKSTSFAGDNKYLSIIATAPATVTPNTNEVITIDIEDANGNSSVTLNGGDGTFELWKIPAATATNNYETGTLLDTASNEKFRFIGIAGFDMVGVDINSNIRRRISMAKGVYTMAFYVGDQIQLAQAPQVIENGIKLDVLQVDLDALITDVEAIKGAGFASTDSLVAINSNVKALPLLSEIEASTVLAKESSIAALGSPLQVDDYLAPDNAKIATIDTNVASIGTVVADLPLLSEIETSTVLAKESSITALGSPLQADDYVVPDNATIAEIQTKVDTLQNVDLSGVPADVWAYAVRTLTTAAGLTEEQVALLEGIKTKTDLLPAQPAGVGDAMTLTTAYDASKTAASQSSVTALGSPLQAGDYVEPDNAGIAVLVTDVGNVPLAVRQELATELARIDVEVSSRSDLTVEDIPEGLTVAEIEASTVLAKEKSVQNTMAIAASRIAF